MRASLKAMLGPAWTARFRSVFRGQPIPIWGNLRRTVPFSANYGFERGTPVDRYYLHRFLEANRDCIQGDVLEIQNVSYTRRFGRNLKNCHSLDITANFSPTYLCDLAHLPETVPLGTYDCFLLPNTAQHLRELEPALRNAWSLIKPGGFILASAACFLPLIPDGPDYWRFSKAGWEEILPRIWPGGETTIQAHGNCLVATAAMLGLAHEELKPAELDAHDPRYPVLLTILARKR